MWLTLLGYADEVFLATTASDETATFLGQSYARKHYTTSQRQALTSQWRRYFRLADCFPSSSSLEGFLFGRATLQKSEIA